jgi:tartrate dehydratase alpha subunit/fumarate hydratase class I-like protein
MDDWRFPSHTISDLPPGLAQALARICEAEGVAPAQVQSIAIDDDEITVRIERRGGGSRIVTYPVTMLLADPTKSRPL